MGWVLLAAGILVCRSQTPPASGNPPPPTIPQVTERGANHQVWQWQTFEAGPNGIVSTHYHKLTELATGMHYWQNGQWVPSVPQINVMADGSAAAVQGQHQAYFPADIFQGQIGLTTPDGLQLQSQPVGLSYADGTKTVFIAILTNSIGQLVASNQITYPNAFAGLKADLLYEYKPSGFEQNVVLRQQPPSPDALGLNPATTRLQMVTEFFDSPEPAQDANDGVMADATLTFGQMKMVQGKAFAIQPNSQLPAANSETTVYKSWVHVDGRTFLIEEVPLPQISAQLATLPLTASSTLPAASPASVLCKVSSSRLLPPSHPAQASTNHIQLARAAFNQNPGLVLDYVALIANQTNYVFQGDGTFYVSGEYNLLGTNIFEGGAVIKMNSSGQIDIDQHGTVVCQTAAYRPTIFTSLNDDSVGEQLSFSSGTPALGDVSTFLKLNATNVTLHDLRFSYYRYGIKQTALPASLDVTNGQFTYGDIAIYGGNVGLHNVLIARSLNEGNGAVDFQGTTLLGENVTGDFGYGFAEAESAGSTVCLTNCLLTRQPLLTPHSYSVTLQTNYTASLPSPSLPVFQTLGGGSYYLTNGSPYRNLGTTNVSAGLLPLLRAKTTWPPTNYASRTFSANLTLYPLVPRDTNAAPDLGYHYDPLDYVVGEATLSANTTMTVAPGTALGWFFTNPYGGAGLWLSDGAQLNGNGTGANPCIVSHYSLVQEGNGNWVTVGWGSALMLNGGSSSNPPQLNCQFTQWHDLNFSGGADFRDYWAYGLANLANCEFYDCAIASFGPAYYFTNCLFDREYVAFWAQDDAASNAFVNCTFYNGCLALCRYSGQSPSYWRIQNTAFDGTGMNTVDNLAGNTSYTAFDYNAYNISNTSWTTYDLGTASSGVLEDAGAHDLTVTNYNWQSGALGNFYLPPNSALIDAGNNNANLVGLYLFTTQTNQNPDTNLVDIGYHYPILGYIPSGLVAYWRLNDGYGSTAKDSVGGNDLTLVGSPTWGEGYLTFNGSSQYGDAGNPSALDIAGDITICAWVNSTSFPASGDLQVPVEKGGNGTTDGSTEGYFIRYFNYGGVKLEDAAYNGSTQVGNSIPNLNQLGQWYFLTAAFDSSIKTWYLYVNATLVGKTTGPFGPLSTSAPLYVGAASISGVTSRFFNGSIHDVGIYKRALSADEIEVNFLNTEFSSKVSVPDLLYYKMTDAEAQQTNVNRIVLSDYSLLGGHNGYGYAPGSVWQWTNNVAGTTNALHFNGANSTLTVTNSSTAFNFTNNPFTANMWVSMEHSSDGYLMQNGAVTSGWYITVGGDHIYLGSETASSSSYVETVGVAVGNDVWHMVTCVWDGTNAFIYIDGSQVAITGTFSAPASSAYSLVMGLDSSGANRLDGQIWLTQIWGSALSPTDIANLYFQQVNGIQWP